MIFASACMFSHGRLLSRAGFARTKKSLVFGARAFCASEKPKHETKPHTSTLASQWGPSELHGMAHNMTTSAGGLFITRPFEVPGVIIALRSAHDPANPAKLV